MLQDNRRLSSLDPFDHIAVDGLRVCRLPRVSARPRAKREGKIYSDLQDVTNTVILECTSNWDLATIYDSCKTRTDYHVFGTKTNATEFDAYERYIKFKGDCSVTAAKPGNSACKKMMNDACMCFYKNDTSRGFWVDVNDNDGPNKINVDQLYLPVAYDSGNTIGITADKPSKTIINNN